MKFSTIRRFFFSLMLPSVFMGNSSLLAARYAGPEKSGFQSTTSLGPEEQKKSITKKGIQARKNLMDSFAAKLKNNTQLSELKKQTLALGPNSVPVLIEVMKDKRFPQKNRWIATFLLGRIMGQKAAPFIAQFVKHPEWVMRLASLKTLLALGQKKFLGVYAHALKDRSLIVRMQALQNIRAMNLKDLAPHVWAMLYDKSNYAGKQKSRKRTSIIKDVILTMGDLQFGEAKRPMLKMIQMKKYRDLFDELNTSLEALTGKRAPSGTLTVKRHFWKREGLNQATL